jgi:hypothetical protein
MRAFILIVLAATTAYADDHELSLGGGTRALRSASADAVTADSLATGAIGYAHQLDVAIVPRLSIWLDTGFGWGAASGTMFQTLSTHVSTDMIFAGARTRYALHQLVDATARFDLGTARTALSLDDGTTTVSDSGWGVLVQGAVGVDLFASHSPSVGFGLRAELGYTATSAVALTPHTDNGSDTLKLQMSDASIGHLDLSGPFFAISLIGEL